MSTTTQSLTISAVIGGTDHIYCYDARLTPVGKRGLNRFGIPRNLRTLSRQATRTSAERYVRRLRNPVEFGAVTKVTDLLKHAEASGVTEVYMQKTAQGAAKDDSADWAAYTMQDGSWYSRRCWRNRVTIQKFS